MSSKSASSTGSSNYSPSGSSSKSRRAKASSRKATTAAPSRRSTARARPLPTADHAAIKRAKLDIQKYLLNTNPAKADGLRAAAEAAISNADACLPKSASGRKSGRYNWRNEVLIVSNQQFSGELDSAGGSNFFNWYALSRMEQWNINKMPEWARNGKPEPTKDTLIEGRPYKMALKSQPR